MNARNSLNCEPTDLPNIRLRAQPDSCVLSACVVMTATSCNAPRVRKRFGGAFGATTAPEGNRSGNCHIRFNHLPGFNAVAINLSINVAAHQLVVLDQIVWCPL